MQHGQAIVLSVFSFLSGCGSPTQSPTKPPAPSPDAISAQPATVYTTGDGTQAWHIRGNRFWSGRPGELHTTPLSGAPASVIYSQTSGAACISLDGVMTFGAPDMLRKGAGFRCGAARFEVVDCDFPENCVNARIAAIWRTGVAPEYHDLPVNYFYNRCRGVQSITFSLDRPLRVGFGETLELRKGLGLLAQPDTPACRRDPGAGLYE